MSIICKLFGHRPREHDYSGGEYMKVSPGVIDGIGREHATLYARCARCEKQYRAGMIHLPERASEKAQRLGREKGSKPGRTNETKPVS